MSAPVRVGIVGTGRMADAFASSLPHASSVTLQGVASRTQDSANRFAARHGAVRAHAGLDALLDDDSVELVYIATPHALHCSEALRSLEAGKHVLCEKPFAINAGEARRMVSLARERGLFLMEAMWTRYLPATVRLRELMAEDVLGQLGIVVAGGAFIPPYDPDDYLFRPDLGGGVMLDAGMYLVSWASMLFGVPDRILASGRIGDHGVDEHDAVLLEHGDGGIAQLYVSLRARRAPDVLLIGEKGSIRMHPPVFAPQALTLSLAGEPERTESLPFDGPGYQFEAMEAAACIRSGRTESALMPLDETLSIMATLDEIRRQIGLSYPMEN